MKKVKDFFSDYHDEDFLAPKSGAKLAFLFDLDRAESQGNDSFQFIAPRQPKRTSAHFGPPPQKQAPPPTAQAVLLATAAHAFCFENGQYLKQGKLGVAILGNHVTKQYKVLLYGSQQKQITTSRIHQGFVLTVQPDNYMSFYDDQCQNWSLKFDSQKAGIDFCKEVCVARWNSQDGADTPVTQDLLLGEGRAVDMDDAVKISFSGWLLQSHAIGQMFDSSVGREKLQRVRLGTGKAPRGLEQGMLGMQKGGRRLLILPASMAYESQGIPNGLPPTSTVVFEVEICWVKLSKDGGCPAVGSADSANASRVPDAGSLRVEETEQPVLRVPPEQGSQASQAKSGPVNVLPKHPDAGRAKLISRMAKMGQSMLPFLIGAIPSNSEPEAGAVSGWGCDAPSLAPSPSSSPQPVQMASSAPPSAAPLKPVSLPHPETPTTVNPPQVLVSSDNAFQSYPIAPLQPLQPVCPPQHMLCYTADVSSFLLTEARRQEAEIRLSVARVADKVDQMATKVDELQKRGDFGLSSISLEAAIILQNVQRIIEENACLKKEVLEKASKVEEQKRNVEELNEQNQRYMEQSNLLLEQKNDTLQYRSQQSHDGLLRAEEEKVRLAEELAASSSRVCELQQEVGCLQQRATELQAKLGAALQDGQSRCALIHTLEAQVEELKNEGEHCRQQWRSEKRKYRKMELMVNGMEEEMQDLRAEKDHLDQILSDKKRKWQLARERLLLEQEEKRQNCVQENQCLLKQLKRARALNTETHPTQQRVALWQEAQSEQQQHEVHVAVQVKRVMNILFHSLKLKFDLQESYTGDFVLRTLLYMIKHVTMGFLKEPEESESETEEEEEEFVSAEEMQNEGKVEKRVESGIRTEKGNDIQARLDKAFDVTAEEMFSLETSQLTADSSVLDEQSICSKNKGLGD
ncbi:FK506-binding protein 15 isoform X2 [Electrophorus electricus]|uniref:FK506-binding protein 15 isoform X2 n=1 Tax=Electrophorus electricus TaxID=8005 RepID=UPI0015D00D7A|nr:FK506-binding protein 15 isoform X2 [Electrophorus electricus]